MSDELPKRLFQPGEETQVHQVNNNCKLTSTIERLEKWLPKELRDVKKDPVFSVVFRLYDNGLGYSGRVIHSLLCRELVTYKMKELWFIFARRPLRFSLQEFHAVTGLECNTGISLKEFEDWEDDDGFWSSVIKKKKSISILTLRMKHTRAVKKWSNADRIRLVYLSIIMCVVCARDEKAIIPLKFIKVVMDLEKLRKYPWGVAAYDLLLESVDKNRDKLMEKTTSYVMDGFSYALQIWAMEALPKIGKLLGKKLDKDFKDGPRCVNWMGAAKLSYEEIIQLENIFSPSDILYPYISWTGNMDVFHSNEFMREGDVNDDRVRKLHELIRTKHDFRKHTWEFEDHPQISVELEVDEKEVETDEEFQTPQESEKSKATSTSSKGKKRLPDRGMEKRKHKVLSSVSKQSVCDEEMKGFLGKLFDQNFAPLEQRLEKQIDERFEKMEKQLRDSLKEGTVEDDHGEPSANKSKAGVRKGRKH